MYREKKLPPLKLYPSWKQQWSMQGIVIKFLVILLIQQENCEQISTILQIVQSFPNCTFQNFNCLKVCIPMCFLPPPLHQWMNDGWGFLSISSLFVFFLSSPLLSVTLRNSSVLKALQSSSRKSEGLRSGNLGCFPQALLPAAPSLTSCQDPHEVMAGEQQPDTPNHSNTSSLPTAPSLLVAGIGAQLRSNSCNPPPPALFPKEEASGSFMGWFKLARAAWKIWAFALLSFSLPSMKHYMAKVNCLE